MTTKIKNRIYRGDLFYADLSPVRGSEQGGIRPVLIIQNDIGNYYSPTVIVAAITSNQKPSLPTHILCGGKKNNLPKRSYILLEQLRTIDRKRLIRFIGHIGVEIMEKVDAALLISIGLNADYLSKQ